MRHILTFIVLMVSVRSFGYEFRRDLEGDRNSKNSFELARSRESKILPLLKDIANRNGNSLEIRRDGKVLAVFSDKDTKGGEDTFYSLVDVSTRAACAILNEQYSEGNQFVVVSLKNGFHQRIAGFPEWSPSGSRLTAVSAGGESGYYPDAVQVWRIGQNSFEKEYDEPTPGDEASWISESKFRYSVSEVDPTRPEAQKVKHWVCKRTKSWKCSPGLK